MYLLVCIAGGLCGDGFVQAYMLKRGLTAGQIGLFGTFSQIAALTAYAFYPRIRKRRGEHRFLCLVTGLYALYPALYALSLTLRRPVAVLALMICGVCLFSGMGALRATSEFALLPGLFPRSDYAQVIGRGGIFGCGAALAISLLGTLFSGGQAVYPLFFLIAFLCLAAMSLLAPRYRAEESALSPGQGMPYGEMLRKLCSRKYALLFLPHLIRGIAMGGMYYLPAVTLPHVDVSSGYLVPATVAGSIAGNWAFLLLSRKKSSRTLIIWANGLCAALMLALPAVRAGWQWLAIYALYTAANIFSQNAVPSGVLRSTAKEDLPFVSSMRMLFTSSASALTILLLAPLAGKVNEYAVCAGAAVVFAAVGLLYTRQFDDRFD